jgi:uncharacterized membrane protein YbhN (UPF0104 family)
MLLAGPTVILRVFRYLGRWRYGDGHVPGWLAGRIDDLHQTVRALRPAQLAGAIFATGVIAALTSAFGVMVSLLTVPHIGLPALIVACAAMPLVSQVPVQGFAGIGTSEAILVAVFVLTGLSKTEALSLGIAAHVYQLVLVSVVGLIGFALARLSRTEEATA